MQRQNLTGCLAALCLAASHAGAHVPIFSDGTATTPEAAVEVGDVTVSRVVYHEVTPSAGQVWVTFQGGAGTRVPFRLGVPLIDRLADLRPVMVVLGPGLPAVDLPFAVPEGLGGVVVQAPLGEALEVFDEEFTGTESWIVGDLDLTLPEDGRYYAMAYVPDGAPGKLWLAMGDREVFSGEDIASLPETINRVRAFHEIELSPVPCFVPLLGAVSFGAVMLKLVRARSRS